MRYLESERTIKKSIVGQEAARPTNLQTLAWDLCHQPILSLPLSVLFSEII